MHETRTTAAGLAAAFLLLAGGAARAEDFNWHGRLAAGQTLEVYGVNGGITADASGGEAEVTATKRAHRSDPASVQVKVIEHAGGVTICAIYPGRSGGQGECAPGHSSQNARNNDVEVSFAVKVPAGVKLLAHTVNGGVRADDVEGDVDAETVNGDVEVRSGGLVRAQTVNGSIEAGMGRADWPGTLKFGTVNGSITLDLPGDLSTELNAEVVNGSIKFDFPLSGSVHKDKRVVRGTIGGGGRELEIETVNGSIALKKH